MTDYTAPMSIELDGLAIDTEATFAIERMMDELAAELDVSVRTIYRDIGALGRQGVPVRGEAGIGKDQLTLNRWSLELGGHCRTGLEDNVRLSRERLADGNAGLVRLAAPMSFGLAHIAPAIADFLKLHPGVEIDLTDVSWKNLR